MAYLSLEQRMTICLAYLREAREQGAEVNALTLEAHLNNMLLSWRRVHTTPHAGLTGPRS